MLALILLSLASPNLQQMIDRAESGATIDVPAGEHFVQLVISRPLTLRGAGAAKTILRADRPGSIISVTASSGTVRIEKLAVKGANTSNGGAIDHRAAAELILEDIDLFENESTDGAGLFIASSAPLVVLRRVFSHHNQAQLGAGAVLKAKRVIVENCTVAHNRGKNTPGLVAIADELELKEVAFSANITHDGRSQHTQLICRQSGCSVLLDRVTFDGAILLGDRGEKIPRVTAKNTTWPLGQ
jgi:nitrous oxidase accessory protein NosD